MFGKFCAQDSESVMLRLYIPALNELISSAVDVYPDGPVQLNVYGEVPSETVILIDPLLSLKQFNVVTEEPSTLAAIATGWLIVAIFGKFLMQDSESVMLRLYVPALKESISSLEAVYPTGPVQLKI